MFYSITWKEFIEFILFSLVVYYAIIGWIYRKEITQWLIRKKNILISSSVLFQSDELNINKEALSRNDNTNLFDTCLNEITTFFEEAKSRKWVKQEMIYSLQIFFKKYNSLKNSSDKETVEKVTTSLSRDICSIHLCEDDLKQLWLG